MQFLPALLKLLAPDSPAGLEQEGNYQTDYWKSNLWIPSYQLRRHVRKEAPVARWARRRISPYDSRWDHEPPAHFPLVRPPAGPILSSGDEWKVGSKAVLYVVREETKNKEYYYASKGDQGAHAWEGKITKIVSGKGFLVQFKKGAPELLRQELIYAHTGPDPIDVEEWKQFEVGQTVFVFFTSKIEKSVVLTPVKKGTSKSHPWDVAVKKVGKQKCLVKFYDNSTQWVPKEFLIAEESRELLKGKWYVSPTVSGLFAIQPRENGNTGNPTGDRIRARVVTMEGGKRKSVIRKFLLEHRHEWVLATPKQLNEVIEQAKKKVKTQKESTTVSYSELEKGKWYLNRQFDLRPTASAFLIKPLQDTAFVGRMDTIEVWKNSQTKRINASRRVIKLHVSPEKWKPATAKAVRETGVVLPPQVKKALRLRR